MAEAIIVPQTDRTRSSTGLTQLILRKSSSPHTRHPISIARTRCRVFEIWRSTVWKMKMPTRRRYHLVMLMFSPMSAWALCCPTGGQINEPAGSGIGQSQPRAADISNDPRWSVHAFERDDISYFQVGSVTGGIEFILGKAGDHFWLLPAGPTDAHIELPGNTIAPVISTSAKVVYEHPEFRLLASEAAGATSWHVQVLPPSP